MPVGVNRTGRIQKIKWTFTLLKRIETLWNVGRFSAWEIADILCKEGRDIDDKQVRHIVSSRRLKGRFTPKTRQEHSDAVSRRWARKRGEIA